jgi:CRP/FNR family cyclic AMP-dependent transcriptional regulator
VLGHLPANALERLAASSRVIRARRGTTLYLPDHPAALYAVRCGRVGMLLQTEAGIEVELGMARPGDLFGELSLFYGRQLEEARALETTDVLALPAEQSHAAIAAHAPAAFAFARLLADRRLLLERRLTETAVYPVRERVRIELERLARNTTVSDSRGYIITDRLTHEELARLVGANRVTVSRAVGELCRRGLITVSGRRIIVKRLSAGARQSPPDEERQVL